MCGFVALAGDAATAPGRIERGLAAIRHRGPDGSGVWRASDGRAALGHARLAILDLSELGAQPMRSADGGAVIAYNGEVYNFRELASQCGVALRSRSDTEVVLELLRGRGPAAVQLLRGMFALAYWDGDELLLVRDRLGIKPLFYAASQGRIAAGSEISTLLAMGAVEPRIDGRAIDDYLTYLYVPPPRTGIVGCRELPPGHLLRWSARGGVHVERYWSPPVEPPTSTPTAMEVRGMLEDAVRSHLVSDAPVGVFLSGGLDSSSIVAFSARHYPGKLRTLNVTFGEEGQHLDERAFASSVARRYGTDHTEIAVQADVACILPDLVSHFGQPFGNPTAALTHVLSRAARAYVKVALAGDGGDEILGGYPRYQGLWAATLVRQLPAGARALLTRMVDAVTPHGSERGRFTNRLRRFVSNNEVSLENMYYRWVAYLDAQRKGQLLADREALLGADGVPEEYEFLSALRARYSERSMRDAACLVDIESFLPCNVLAYGDRMSMAHALEVRVPYCDHLLVERLASLPLATKMPGGIQKGLLRLAVRKDLPARVVTHAKIGFNPPIAPWLRGSLAAAVHEHLGDSALRATGILDRQAVARIRDEFLAGRANGDAHVLWSLLVLQAWSRWLSQVSLRPATMAEPTSTS